MRLFQVFLAALLTLTSLMFVGKAEASCVGSQCNDKDAVEEGCVTKEEVDSGRTRAVDTRTFGTYSYNPWWNKQTRTRIVVLMYSEKCRANWARADVPLGTTIYVEEKFVPATKRGYYTTKTYGWGYGNMSTGNVPNRACALFPNDPYPKCTEFK